MADYDVGAAFAAIENELISSMMRNLNRHRAEETKEGILWPQWQAQQLEALEEYRRKNQKAFKSRFSSINRRLESAIRTAYTDGETAQEREILEAIRQGFSTRQQTDSLGAGFFTTNQRKLDALVNATTKDMKRAETAILRRVNDQYRKIIFNAQVYANTGAGTYEKAVDMATKDFLAAGIDCVVYSNGARHTLSDYADMALRTASKRAYLQGEGTKRQEWGIATVILTKRSNACPKCAQFCGKVFIDDVWSGGTSKDGDYPLLSSAIEQGLYHPRCKDSHTTYFPELSEEQEAWSQTELKGMEQREVAEQREQYAERQAEKYRRLEQFSLDEENRRKYGARAQEWEEQTDATPSPKIVEKPAVAVLPAHSTTQEAVVDNTPQVAIDSTSEPVFPAVERQEENAVKETPTVEIVPQPILEDVTSDYLSTATPGIGEIEFDDDYDMSRHKAEVDIAQWIHDNLGGDIRLLNESKKYKTLTPDYIWRGKLWDLKSTTTEKSADSAVRHGLKQIFENPGGIILNYGQNEISVDKLKKALQSRIRNSAQQSVDIIVLQNENLLIALRHKK